MKINTIYLFIKDSLKNLFRTPTSTIGSISVVASSILILGLFVLSLWNFQIGIIGVYSEYKIEVSLKDDINIKDMENIYTKLKTITGVISINSINDNPPSYTIKVNGPDNIPNVISEINGLQGINKVNGGQTIPRKILIITKILLLVGVFIFFIIILVSFLIIRNTIKICVYSRQNEIRIMQYIGATDSFIKNIFTFQGIVFGFIGSTFAVLVTYHLYNFIYVLITPYLSELFISFISPSFILSTMSWSFTLIGITLSALGSAGVIRKVLVA